MKAVTLLLHDERYSGWSTRDKVTRRHFSLQYLHFYEQAGYESLLYTFHQSVNSKQTYHLGQSETMKVFPVKLRFPPLLRFGNDHNVGGVTRELTADQPDLVHFHNYYLFSFPYVARHVKKTLNKTLIAQLHGYDNRHVKKWLYLPCLLALRHADRILYSYEPEKATYSKLGIEGKAVKIPVPGIDPELFQPKKQKRNRRLLYVGRVPSPLSANGEKSPFLLIQILKRLLRLASDVSMDVVGDGPGLHYLRRTAKRLGIEDHVVFHGYVPHFKLPEYYVSSALTFSPIRVFDVDGWFDGAIQESLACGTPVAAFKTMSKTPLNGTYGFLLSNDAGRAAQELYGLLRAPERMEDLAAEGSRFVRSRCSFRCVVSELGEMLEEVNCS